MGALALGALVTACLAPIRATAQGAREWTRIPGGAETGCALGTPYAFFHREGDDSRSLLVWFQGGGACWDWVSCSGLFDSDVADDELSPYAGIFDRSNPENPFRDFEIVFVPYCTGDVHVGDTTRVYGDDPSAPPVSQIGYRNVTRVLDWMDARGLHPRQVVVAGASAGAYGALFYAPEIARRFPGADVLMLGDSGIPLLAHNPEVLRDWNADSVLRRLWREPSRDADRQPLREAYRQAAAVAPRLRLAQITSDRDRVQSAFFLVSGSPEWRTVTYALLRDARELAPGLRSFVVGGSDHGLLRTDAFFEYAADGVSLRDWVARLVRGEQVQDVRCRPCGID
jgi:hypothetical protein